MDCLPACLVLIKPCPEKTAGGERKNGGAQLSLHQVGPDSSCQFASGCNPDSGPKATGHIHLSQLPGVTEKWEIPGSYAAGYETQNQILTSIQIHRSKSRL